MSQDNMRIWGAVSATDPAHVKRVNQRGGFSAVCATYQVRQATELWGPMGSAWGPEDVVYEVVEVPNGSLVTCELDLVYPGGRVQAIKAACDFVAKGRADCEAWKKARTNAITKALSQLGFAADVFLGLFDDNQYVRQHAARMAQEQGAERTRRKEQAQPPAQPAPPPQAAEAQAPAPTPSGTPPASSPGSTGGTLRVKIEGLGEVVIPPCPEGFPKERWINGARYGLKDFAKLQAKDDNAAERIYFDHVKTASKPADWQALFDAIAVALG